MEQLDLMHYLPSVLQIALQYYFLFSHSFPRIIQPKATVENNFFPVKGFFSFQIYIYINSLFNLTGTREMNLLFDTVMSLEPRFEFQTRSLLDFFYDENFGQELASK